MTTAQLIAYYKALLILQYAGKERASATIAALVTMVIMDQLPIAVQNAFDPAFCEGVQLDVIGTYVGVTRNGYGVDNLPVVLSDADFRQLINFAIIRNTNGSSLADIDDLLFKFFGLGVTVEDNSNMQMNYTVHGVVGSRDLVAVVESQDLFPRPMGVQLASITYIVVDGDPFGWGTYLIPAFAVSPFNTYDDYNEDYPWLGYT